MFRFVLPVLSVAIIVISAGAVAQRMPPIPPGTAAPTNVIFAKMQRINAALEYPDPVELEQVYGTLTVSLKANGTKTSADGNRTSTLDLTASRTIRKLGDGAATFSEKTNGVFQQTVRDQKVLMHGEWKASDAGTLDDDQSESAPVSNGVVSKRRKLMHAGVVLVPLINGTNSDNYIIADGKKAPLSNLSVVAFQRLPLYSAANTPFAALAKQMESTPDINMLSIGNTIECPWDPDTGAAQGQYTVPVTVFINATSTAAVYYPESTTGFIPKPEQDDSGRYFTGTVSVRWQWSTKPIAGKMRFYPNGDYRNWLPKGDGATISTRVKIEPKSEKHNAPVGRIDFYLRNVSKEPGTCLNSQDDNTEPDLRFADAPGIIIDAQDPTHAYTERDDIQEATINIESRDYGAFGELVAKCAEHELTAKYEGTGEELLRIPADKNKNRIADAWEEQQGILEKNYDATWDKQETPALNGNPGDGLTLYEEYRGLLVEGKHTRLNPTVKNLVVMNEAPGAEGGIALFAAATKLHVVRVRPGELLPDPNDEFDATVVNLRSKFAYAGRQHGVRIIAGPMGDGDGVGGMTQPKKAGAKVTHCPGEVACIVMSTHLADDAKEFGAAVPNRDVAHELGHALGAQHHGDAPAPLVERLLGTQMVPPRYAVYGVDGVLFTDRPFKIEGMIGVPGNEMSSDTRCIMAYTGIFTWALHQDGANYTYYNAGQTTPGTVFCTSLAGTGINAEDHKPVSLFGNAAAGRGNCLGMMKVRDY